MQILHTDEMRDLKERAGDVPIINVLPRSSHHKKHIPGSDNIPVDEEGFVEHVRDKVGGEDQPVVVYCASAQCDASPRAARKLEEAGFSHVIEYEDGIEGWERAGLPVESGT
jgi:rhodanese-related sulfurtransferase